MLALCKQQIKEDLIGAFEISGELIEQNRALFNSSSSFFNFLLKLCDEGFFKNYLEGGENKIHQLEKRQEILQQKYENEIKKLQDDIKRHDFENEKEMKKHKDDFEKEMKKHRDEIETYEKEKRETHQRYADQFQKMDQEMKELKKKLEKCLDEKNKDYEEYKQKIKDFQKADAQLQIQQVTTEHTIERNRLVAECQQKINEKDRECSQLKQELESTKQNFQAVEQNALDTLHSKESELHAFRMYHERLFEYFRDIYPNNVITTINAIERMIKFYFHVERGVNQIAGMINNMDTVMEFVVRMLEWVQPYVKKQKRTTDNVLDVLNEPLLEQLAIEPAIQFEEEANVQLREAILEEYKEKLKDCEEKIKDCEEKLKENEKKNKEKLKAEREKLKESEDKLKECEDKLKEREKECQDKLKEKEKELKSREENYKAKKLKWKQKYDDQLLVEKQKLLSQIQTNQQTLVNEYDSQLQLEKQNIQVECNKLLEEEKVMNESRKNFMERIFSYFKESFQESFTNETLLQTVEHIINFYINLKQQVIHLISADVKHNEMTQFFYEMLNLYKSFFSTNPENPQQKINDLTQKILEIEIHEPKFNELKMKYAQLLEESTLKIAQLEKHESTLAEESALKISQLETQLEEHKTGSKTDIEKLNVKIHKLTEENKLLSEEKEEQQLTKRLKTDEKHQKDMEEKQFREKQYIETINVLKMDVEKLNGTVRELTEENQLLSEGKERHLSKRLKMTEKQKKDKEINSLKKTIDTLQRKISAYEETPDDFPKEKPVLFSMANLKILFSSLYMYHFHMMDKFTKKTVIKVDRLQELEMLLNELKKNTFDDNSTSILLEYIQRQIAQVQGKVWMEQLNETLTINQLLHHAMKNTEAVVSNL